MSRAKSDIELEVAAELFGNHNNHNNSNTNSRSLLRRRGTLNRPERKAVANRGDKTEVFFDGTSSWWTYASWMSTCCFPPALLTSMGIVGKNPQQAWREKVTLCWIVAIMSGSVLFFILFFGDLACPPSLRKQKISISITNGVLIRGLMYSYEQAKIPYNTLFASEAGGYDASSQFTQPDIPACANINSKVTQFKFPCETTNSCLDSAQLVLPDGGTYGLRLYATLLDRVSKVDPSASYEWSDVTSRKLTVYKQVVVDLSPYLSTPADPLDEVDTLIRKAAKLTDASHLFSSRPDLKNIFECVAIKYSAGILTEQSFECVLSSIILAVASIMVISVLLTRFAMALLFGWFLSSKLSREPLLTDFTNESAASYIRRRPPPIPTLAAFIDPDLTRVNKYAEAHNIRFQQLASTNPLMNFDLYCAILVTCYSEGEESIRSTLDALANTIYDDQKKLLIVVADGIITGKGNKKSTPEIIIDMIDVERAFGTSPKPYSYVAVASDSKQHNMAQVYCGYYRASDATDPLSRVPIVVIVKCGTPDEADSPKPGNRGKRDSQVILMNFFSRVILNDHMTPLDFDLFRKIHFVCGITPDFFETILMVDADTKVAPESIRLLINCMHNEPNIMGLCGETQIANKSQNWVTRIQVFEYYISHHLGKAFESVFGGVTCLPGCFSMYRIKARKGDNWVPILVAPEITHVYSSNVVETLHQKNLLLLGEDRFLSTVMLRTFPHRQMYFIPNAKCKTVVPDDFKTLLSQRRRWINSTIHNLMELLLVDELCGTFCFSMQFIVFMDLIGTATLPISLFVTYFLIYRSIFVIGSRTITSWLELSMFLAVIFMPAILIMLTRFKVSRLGWFAIYLIFLPVWQVILPLYAFWRFDDFTWGDTRKVEGATDGHQEDKKLLDASTVPLRRWEDYERAYRRSLIKKRQQSKQSLPVAAIPIVQSDEQNFQSDFEKPGRTRRESIMPDGGFSGDDFPGDYAPGPMITKRQRMQIAAANSRQTPASSSKNTSYGEPTSPASTATGSKRSASPDVLAAKKSRRRN